MELSAKTKAQLRQRFRHDRALSQSTTSFDSWMHILESQEIKSAHHIASYISYGDEPQTHDLNQAILKSGKVLYLPRLLPDNSLEWIQWNGDQSSLKKKKNVFEPQGLAIDPSNIEVFIVPALHINREGYRLGQGGGSYDRALAGHNAWKIGLVYAGELTNEDIAVEPHDQKLSAAATPALIVRFS